MNSDISLDTVLREASLTSRCCLMSLQPEHHCTLQLQGCQMGPAGWPFRFDLAVRYIVMLVGAADWKENMGFLSVTGSSFIKPGTEFLVSKGLWGTNSHFLVFVKIGKCFWRL